MKYAIFYSWCCLLVLCGCERRSGPIEIAWDRDTCARCGMVISDKHFAAQVRGGSEGQTQVFDDIGCALQWLEEQSWKARAEVWVADYRSGQWLDARQAYYVAGRLTPMNYGLGATSKPVARSVNFEAAQLQLLKKSQ